MTSPRRWSLLHLHPRERADLAWLRPRALLAGRPVDPAEVPPRSRTRLATLACPGPRERLREFAGTVMLCKPSQGSEGWAGRERTDHRWNGQSPAVGARGGAVRAERAPSGWQALEQMRKMHKEFATQAQKEKR